MPDYPDLSHPWPDGDDSIPFRRWTLGQSDKPASLISLENQLLAAKQLLEEHGFRVIPVKSLDRWKAPSQDSETNPNA